MTHLKSEIGIFNYFCNSITYSSEIWMEFVIEKMNELVIVLDFII